MKVLELSMFAHFTQRNKAWPHRLQPSAKPQSASAAQNQAKPA